MNGVRPVQNKGETVVETAVLYWADLTTVKSGRTCLCRH